MISIFCDICDICGENIFKDILCELGALCGKIGFCFRLEFDSKCKILDRKVL